MVGNRVLVVDDDFIINLELNEYLKASGFEVESVYSGSTALEALRRCPPWALVTDLDLGRGPDGFEVARQARLVCPGLPVVYISASRAGRHAAQGVSGSEFFAKPCESHRIVEALNRAVRLGAA